MTEKEFLERRIVDLNTALGGIQDEFHSIREAHERAIDEVITKAGVMAQVRQLRDNLKAEKQRLQSKADNTSGQVTVLQELLEKFHPNVPAPAAEFPIPEGMTHKYGIDLRPLDGETRALVLAENPDTIRALGGTVPLPPTNIEPPAFTYEEEVGEEDDGDWGDEGGSEDPNLDAIRSMMDR